MSVSCLACSSPLGLRTLQVAEMMFGLNEAHEYGICDSCGSVQLLEIPADFSRYYPQDYYSVDLDPEKAFTRPIRLFARLVSRSRLLGEDRVATGAVSVLRKRQFQTLMSIESAIRRTGVVLGTDAAVLDVGCGSGMLTYALGLSGIRTVVGVDPFASADRLFDNGARVLKCGVEDVQGEYDLVMFHHSLEHVPDPAGALHAAMARLRPGGAILVRMPTVSSDAFATYGPAWVQFDAPRHITLFSRSGVRALAGHVGLKVLSETDDSTAFQFWGSEQVMRRIPLESPRSHMIAPKKSVFSRSQITKWEKEAAALNMCRRGDQSAWVLAP